MSSILNDNKYYKYSGNIFIYLSLFNFFPYPVKFDVVASYTFILSPSILIKGQFSHPSCTN